jgi:NH3-dependent NAD+ synthetase
MRCTNNNDEHSLKKLQVKQLVARSLVNTSSLGCTSGLYQQVSNGRFNASVLKKTPTSKLFPDEGFTAEQVQQFCDMQKKF